MIVTSNVHEITSVDISENSTDKAKWTQFIFKLADGTEVLQVTAFADEDSILVNDNRGKS